MIYTCELECVTKSLNFLPLERRKKKFEKAEVIRENGAKVRVNIVEKHCFFTRNSLLPDTESIRHLHISTWCFWFPCFRCTFEEGWSKLPHARLHEPVPAALGELENIISSFSKLYNRIIFSSWEEQLKRNKNAISTARFMFNVLIILFARNIINARILWVCEFSSMFLTLKSRKE